MSEIFSSLEDAPSWVKGVIVIVTGTMVGVAIAYIVSGGLI